MDKVNKTFFIGTPRKIEGCSVDNVNNVDSLWGYMCFLITYPHKPTIITTST